MVVEENILFFVAISTALLFAIYIFLFYSPFVQRRKFFKLPAIGTLQHTVLERFTGFLILGVIPGIVIFYSAPGIHSADLGFILPDFVYILPSVIFWALLILFTSYYSGKPVMRKCYPQIRTEQWDIKLILINGFTWILYLLGYEFFFRGLLIFPLLSRFGVAGTLVLNVLLYSLAHLHKGFREVAGSFIFGLFLTSITIQTGSLWISFLSHLTLAFSNDYFAYRANLKIRTKQ